MGLNTKCPKHGSLHPDFLCLDKEKNTYKYCLKRGSKTVYCGITYDLARREAEHQKDYPGSRIKQIGQRTTREKALKWLKSKTKKQKPKEAFIASVATDQGTGGSWCSNCEYPLDGCLWKWSQEIIDNIRQQTEVWSEGFYKCPNCGAKLKWGGVYTPLGVSDF